MNYFTCPQPKRKLFPVGTLVCISGKICKVARKDGDVIVLTHKKREFRTHKNWLPDLVSDALMPEYLTNPTAGA